MRSHFRYTVQDGSGNAVQNAKVRLYLPDTTGPVTDAWSAATAGVAVTYLISNSQGEVECWFDSPQDVDVSVEDNNDSAYYPGQQGTDLLELGIAAADVALLAANNTLTGDNTLSGDNVFTGTADFNVIRQKGPARIDLTHRNYGMDPSNSAADNKTAVLAALSDLRVGGTAFLPPADTSEVYSCAGGWSVPAGKTLSGEGWSWQRDSLGAFANAGNTTVANYSGSILSVTSTSGVGITCDTSATGQAGRLENVLLVGPGSGTATGVALGNASHFATETDWKNVGVLNFATGAAFANAEECEIHGLRIFGCTTPITFGAGTNNSNFYGLGIQQCTNPATFDVASLSLAFYGLILQSNAGTGMVLKGKSHTIYTPHAENNGGIAIQIGGATCYGMTINGGYFNSSSDSIDILSSAQTTSLMNVGPETLTITNASNSTFLLGSTSNLTDTSGRIRYIDPYNNTTTLMAAYEPHGAAASRPSASGEPAGRRFFNETTAKPNETDGAGNWRDAAGNIV